MDDFWHWHLAETAVVGQRVSGEVVAVDVDAGRVRLSTAATEKPELWTFLKGLRHGEVLDGTVAAIERFGVFVALDEGPEHPVYPGVGFITIPELSWRHFDAASDVVAIGQRVSCEFLQFDTWNGEARLSLRGMAPDPFLVFVEGIAAGQRLSGRVTKLVPFGVFVEVADGIEEMVHLSELSSVPVAAPEDVVQVGDRLNGRRHGHRPRTTPAVALPATDLSGRGSGRARGRTAAGRMRRTASGPAGVRHRPARRDGRPPTRSPAAPAENA
ncbi:MULTISPECIES: S1 RNA-binding domain-containing protein [unclassified Streptomyces]|uniref:S1 RNA-binding domain-containing protein n=1 Tax=unclassified Streptomyces TaxID=2593676 RepID=UPI003447D393